MEPSPQSPRLLTPIRVVTMRLHTSAVATQLHLIAKLAAHHMVPAVMHLATLTPRMQALMSTMMRDLVQVARIQGLTQVQLRCVGQ